MALDILVEDFKGNAEKLLHFSIEDFYFIADKIKDKEDFALLKGLLIDYYADSEVYLNDLETLQTEVSNFQKLFESSSPEDIKKFMAEFSALINYAIERRRTIKFVAD